MRDLITTGVKTAVQVVVAALITWLASLGIDIAEMQLAVETALFAVVSGLVAIGLNWVGQKIPFVNRLLSLGLTKESASYTEDGIDGPIRYEGSQ
jgi:hypothetical protein